MNEQLRMLYNNRKKLTDSLTKTKGKHKNVQHKRQQPSGPAI